MFLQELNPLFQELVSQPLAFVNGFVTGALRLNLNDDPLKTWLEQQGFNPNNPGGSNKSDNGSKPQSISID